MGYNVPRGQVQVPMVDPGRHLCSSSFFRTWELGSVGLSEDEANKILAVQSYAAHFTPIANTRCS